MFIFCNLGELKKCPLILLSLFQILFATPPCRFPRLHWAGPWQPIVLCGPRANKWQPPSATAWCCDTHTCISMAGHGPINHPWASRDTYSSVDAGTYVPAWTKSSYQWIIRVCVRQICGHTHEETEIYIVWTQACTPLSTLWLYISVILGLILIQT